MLGYETYTVVMTFTPHHFYHGWVFQAMSVSYFPPLFHSGWSSSDPAPLLSPPPDKRALLPSTRGRRNNSQALHQRCEREDQVQIIH